MNGLVLLNHTLVIELDETQKGNSEYLSITTIMHVIRKTPDGT